MGYSEYSLNNRSARSKSLGYETKSAKEIFSNDIHREMIPNHTMMRESRDSGAHPNSVAIIIALDVTGSMGRIPHELVRHGLPKIVSSIIEAGIPDPQIMFLAIGDAECDRWPLQVSQFESGDAELDMWLTRTYIETGGGGNGGESYHLAWYFAAKNTDIDCWNKRGQRGFIFTIGDEPVLPRLNKSSIKEFMDDGDARSYTNEELVKMASERYHVFHINLDNSYHKPAASFKMLGENYLNHPRNADVANVIIEKVIQHTKKSWLNSTSIVEDQKPTKSTSGINNVVDEIINL